MFENAALEQNTASREKSAKSAAEVEKGREMRQLSLETMGESAKRKGQRSDSGGEKRMRGNGRSTFELLNEKLKFDIEWRKKELELKQRELEIRLKETSSRRREKQM